MIRLLSENDLDLMFCLQNHRVNTTVEIFSREKFAFIKKLGKEIKIDFNNLEVVLFGSQKYYNFFPDTGII